MNGLQQLTNQDPMIEQYNNSQYKVKRTRGLNDDH